MDKIPDKVRELLNIMLWFNAIGMVLAIIILMAFGELGRLIALSFWLLSPVINMILALSCFINNQPVRVREELLATKQEEAPEITSEVLLDRIAQLMHVYGTHREKKHGEWICLDLNNGTYFDMDSYNGAIWFCLGIPEYNYHVGHREKATQTIYLGLSNALWRGSDYELPCTLEEYRKYVLIISDFVVSCYGGDRSS